MKKQIALSLLLAVSLLADLSNQTSNSKSDSNTERNSEQKSINQSDSKTIQNSRGGESSETKTLSQTLSQIKSSTKSVTRSSNGSWSVSINPIPYILSEMRALGWDRRAFSLRNDDIGTSFFYQGNSDIIDLNAKAYGESKAASRGTMSKEQINKLQDAIELLDFSGAVALKASELMKDSYKPGLSNIEEVAKDAVLKANDTLMPKKYSIQQCHFGGNNDTYDCNDGEFTVVLTSSVPTLMKNGTAYYSSERVGYAQPTLTLSVATNDSDALSIVEQDTQSKAVAQAVREYTSKLEQSGQSEVASKIKTAMIEKALTSNLSTTANATVQAINSGSPTAVLKIFQ